MVTRIEKNRNKPYFSCSVIKTSQTNENQPNPLPTMWSHLHDFYLSQHLTSQSTSFQSCPDRASASRVLTSTLGVNVFCSRTPHGATSGDLTQGLWIQSLMLHLSPSTLPYFQRETYKYHKLEVYQSNQAPQVDMSGL